MIITGLTYTMFFVAGIIFNDMIRASKDGWIPFLLAFVMSILWPLMLVWWFINKWSDTTTVWYITLAKVVFIER